MALCAHLQSHTVTRKRRPRPRQVQRDRAIASRCAQPRIDGYPFVAEFVHEFESQQVTSAARRGAGISFAGRRAPFCFFGGDFFAFLWGFDFLFVDIVDILAIAMPRRYSGDILPERSFRARLAQAMFD